MGKGRGSKRQRGKRAWFKRYSRSSLNSGPSKVAGYVNEQGNPVLITIGSRSKVAKSFETMGQTEPPRDAQERAIRAGNPRALLETQISNNVFKEKHEYRHVWLKQYKYERCKAIFDRDGCVLVHFKIIGGVVRMKRSISYPNINFAKQYYELGRICWIEPVKVYRLGPDGKLIIPPESPDNTVCTT